MEWYHKCKEKTYPLCKWHNGMGNTPNLRLRVHVYGMSQTAPMTSSKTSTQGSYMYK